MDKPQKSNIWVKIAVPAVIVMVVIGIWFIKNNTDSQSPPADNPDFALLTDELDIEQLKTYGMPIMLDFGSDSCIPCKAMAPVLKEINEDYQGKAIVKFMDVWKDQILADGFPLEVIPTQFFFTADGKPFVPSDPEAMEMLMYTTKANGEHVYTAHQGGMTKEQILAVFKEMGVE